MSRDRRIVKRPEMHVARLNTTLDMLVIQIKIWRMLFGRKKRTASVLSVDDRSISSWPSNPDNLRGFDTCLIFTEPEPLWRERPMVHWSAMREVRPQK